MLCFEVNRLIHFVGNYLTWLRVSRAGLHCSDGYTVVWKEMRWLMGSNALFMFKHCTFINPSSSCFRSTIHYLFKGLLKSQEMCLFSCEMQFHQLQGKANACKGWKVIQDTPLWDGFCSQYHHPLKYALLWLSLPFQYYANLFGLEI